MDEIIAIRIPLVIEAKTIDNVTSAADKGLPIMSTIVPIIFPIKILELEWAKLCCITCIIIRPLAKNSKKGTPKTFDLSSPTASEITVKKRIAVSIGPIKV